MIVLDTHVLAWLLTDPDRLSRPAASAIRRARISDGLAIASITLWELALMFSRGSLRAPGTIEDALHSFVARSGVSVRPITPEIASVAAQFPDSYPRDPADRLIGATARAESMPLVTRDERIRSSPLLRTIW